MARTERAARRALHEGKQAAALLSGLNDRDVLYINGVSFATASQNTLLHGPPAGGAATGSRQVSRRCKFHHTGVRALRATAASLMVVLRVFLCTGCFDCYAGKRIDTIHVFSHGRTETQRCSACTSLPLPCCIAAERGAHNRGFGLERRASTWAFRPSRSTGTPTNRVRCHTRRRVCANRISTPEKDPPEGVGRQRATILQKSCGTTRTCCTSSRSLRTEAHRGVRLTFLSAASLRRTTVFACSTFSSTGVSPSVPDLPKSLD
jgi:hypothetical protein